MHVLFAVAAMICEMRAAFKGLCISMYTDDHHDMIFVMVESERAER